MLESQLDTSDKGAGSGILPGNNTVGRSLRIIAHKVISSECVEVVHRDLGTQLFYQNLLGPFLGQGITHGQIADAQEVAAIQEA